MKTKLGLKPLQPANPADWESASPISVTLLRWVDVLTVRYACSKRDARRLLSAALDIPTGPTTTSDRAAVRERILERLDLIVFGVQRYKLN
jgi:hypothetical protein